MSDIKFGIELDLIDKATKGLKKFQSEVKRTGQSVLNFGKRLASSKLSLAAFTAAVGFTVKSAADQQRALVLLTKQLENNAGAVGLTRSEIIGLSRELQKTTGVSDEVTQSAQSLLLGFKALGREAFERTTRLTLDMTGALNDGKITQDGLRRSALQLGKALDDPIIGITNLRRVGISFSEQQQKAIKDYVEAGDTLEAQRVILGALEAKFEGTAAVLKNTLRGQLRATKDSFGDLTEELGIGLAQVIEKDVLPQLQALLKNLDDVLDPEDIINFGAKFISVFSFILTETKIGFETAKTYGKNLRISLAGNAKAIAGSFKIAALESTNFFNKNKDKIEKAQLEIVSVISKANRDIAENVLDYSKFRGDQEQALQKRLQKIIKISNERIQAANDALALNTGDSVEEIVDLQDEHVNAYIAATKKIEKEKEKQKTINEKHLEDQVDLYRDFAKNILNESDTFGQDVSSWAEGLAESLVNGPSGLVKGLESQLVEMFPPQVAGFLSTAVGGAISGFVVSLVTAIFGNKPTKSVAKTAEEQFETMVTNTNKALEDLGREKTITEKQLELTEKLIDKGQLTIETSEQGFLLGGKVGDKLSDIVKRLSETRIRQESSELSAFSKQFVETKMLLDTLTEQLTTGTGMGGALGATQQQLADLLAGNITSGELATQLTPGPGASNRLLDALNSFIGLSNDFEGIKDNLSTEQLQRALDVINIENQAGSIIEKINQPVLDTIGDLSGVVDDANKLIEDLNEDVRETQAEPISLEEKREEQQLLVNAFKEAFGELLSEAGSVNVLGTGQTIDDVVKNAVIAALTGISPTAAGVELGVPIIKITIDGKELTNVITEIQNESKNLNLEGEFE